MPKFFINTDSKLDQLSNNTDPIFKIAIKKPSAFKHFNPKRDDGKTKDKNLIMDLDITPNAIQFIGRRYLLSKNNPWFQNVPVNHPILSQRNDGICSVFFNFEMADKENRILIVIDIYFDDFECDEPICAYISAGGENIHKNELTIRAPCSAKKIKFYNYQKIILKRFLLRVFSWWSSMAVF